MNEYRELLGRLSRLADEAAAHRDEAGRWAERRHAAADEAERAAEVAVRAARHAIRLAQRELEAVDARAAGLWSDFVHRVGPAAERFGRTVPDPVVPRQRGDRGAQDYLQDVATRLAYTPAARPLTRGIRFLFGLFGALGAATGFAVAQVLRLAGHEAGGDWSKGLPVVALIIMLIGPFLGLAAAKPIVDRRRVPLDAAAVAVVLLTGLATVAVLAGFLR